MGFQVYNSQGQELQNLTGSAGGDLTGTYPNPTIDKAGKGLVAAQNTWAGNSKTVSAANTDYVISSITFTGATGRYYELAWGFDIYTDTNAQARLRLKNGSTQIGDDFFYGAFGTGGGTMISHGTYVFTLSSSGSVTLDLVGRSSSANTMYFGSVIKGRFSIKDVGSSA